MSRCRSRQTGAADLAGFWERRGHKSNHQVTITEAIVAHRTPVVRHQRERDVRRGCRQADYRPRLLEAVTSARADAQPTGASAFRAFLRHSSALVPFLRQVGFVALAARQPAGIGSAQILRSHVAEPILVPAERLIRL